MLVVLLICRTINQFLLTLLPIKQQTNIRKKCPFIRKNIQSLMEDDSVELIFIEVQQTQSLGGQEFLSCPNLVDFCAQLDFVLCLM